MNDLIAALPMYDWPETRDEVDAEWRLLRAALAKAGIHAPAALTRRNGEMPAVPGGIRDTEGRVIAPDPASLPPDEFDLPTLWRHPGLLLAQTCWGPLELGLAAHARVVGQPSYDGIEGGAGALYSSAVVMRAEARLVAVAAPEDGTAALPVAALRGKRLAFNGVDSMSGYLALQRDLAAAGDHLSMFSQRLESGSHRASLAMVAAGEAEVCAVDCRSWRMAQLHETGVGRLAAVGWTARRKGLPLVTSRHTPECVVAALKAALA